jgi:hypothetical protein
MGGHLRAWDQARAPGPEVSPAKAAARIKIVLSEPAEVIDLAMQPDDPVPSKPRYWFPAKRYGWGWGPPSTWQGWVELGVYVGLLVALCLLFPVSKHPYWFWAGLMVLVTGLIAICLWKGEPLRWRWNKF